MVAHELSEEIEAGFKKLCEYWANREPFEEIMKNKGETRFRL